MSCHVENVFDKKSMNKKLSDSINILILSHNIYL